MPRFVSLGPARSEPPEPVPLPLQMRHEQPRADTVWAVPTGPICYRSGLPASRAERGWFGTVGPRSAPT